MFSLVAAINLAVVSFGGIYFFGSKTQRSARKASHKKAQKAQNEICIIYKQNSLLSSYVPFCGSSLDAMRIGLQEEHEEIAEKSTKRKDDDFRY